MLAFDLLGARVGQQSFVRTSALQKQRRRVRTYANKRRTARATDRLGGDNARGCASLALSVCFFLTVFPCDALLLVKNTCEGEVTCK